MSSESDFCQSLGGRRMAGQSVRHPSMPLPRFPCRPINYVRSVPEAISGSRVPVPKGTVGKRTFHAQREPVESCFAQRPVNCAYPGTTWVCLRRKEKQTEVKRSPMSDNVYDVNLRETGRFRRTAFLCVTHKFNSLTRWPVYS